ncbi:DNA translocase FtsK [Bacillus massilinigeriensis]|uniref:DNA translocase FtsK n=1 Tax=Bacillus mediterraneensis TaxID=1805474 RepID=UPI0008F8F89A
MEEEEIIEIDESKKAEEKTHRKLPHYPQGKKELDTRVLYQYPKGKFKFPLIPDAGLNEQEKMRRKRPATSGQTKRPDVAVKPTVHKPDADFTTEGVSGKVERPYKKSRQPFRPTEIPSPIYAFSRPKKETVIEVELSGFSNKQRENEDLLKTIAEEETETAAVTAEKTFYPSKEETNHAAVMEAKTELKSELEPKPEPKLESELEPKSDPAPRRHVPFNVMMLKSDKNKQKISPNRQRSVEVSQVQRGVKRESATPGNRITNAVDKESADSDYSVPPTSLLDPPVHLEADWDWLDEQEILLNQTMNNFNVGAKVVHVTQGPSVTRFEVQPDPGVKVNKITNLSDDIKLSLAAKDIRIEAPIPGKHTIGIEVPNEKSRPVQISEIIGNESFGESSSPLAVALGLDISGKPIITDLRKMPHGLIAGATGSGKSVCINTMIVSLLFKAHPDEVKLLLIDPKMVELAPYNHIPHLVSPVITDVKAATAALKWAVEEMERRYALFAHTGVRDIGRFNSLAEEQKRDGDKLPLIVIVIDELADLMMMSPADVEEAICRIAQKARACGIHLIIATQRPSVDVITGLIKANVPTRIAFSVSSQVDSRTIIDIGGAEKLLGKGDMLFLENGASKPFRLQGTFVSDREIDDIVAFVRKQKEPKYLFEQDELIKRSQVTEEEDELFFEACEFVIEQGTASTSSVQRRFKVGYNRAARLIDMMEKQGFISEGRGSRPRDVLISPTDLEAIQETSILV